MIESGLDLMVCDQVLNKSLEALVKLFSEKEQTKRRALELEAGERINLTNKRVEAVDILASSLSDYLKTLETHKTERKRIKDGKILAIKQINAQKELFIKLIDSQMAERDKNIDRFFNAIEKVLDQDDHENQVKILELLLDKLDQQIKQPLTLSLGNASASVKNMMLDENPEEF